MADLHTQWFIRVTFLFQIVKKRDKRIAHVHQIPLFSYYQSSLHYNSFSFFAISSYPLFFFRTITRSCTFVLSNFLSFLHPFLVFLVLVLVLLPTLYLFLFLLILLFFFTFSCNQGWDVQNLLRSDEFFSTTF